MNKKLIAILVPLFVNSILFLLLFFLAVKNNTLARANLLPSLQAQESIATEAFWHGYASGNNVRSNLLIDENHVWVGTGGGVVRWDQTDKSYQMYLPTDGLVSFSVDSIVKDQQGNLWFGTYSGLSKFDGDIWKNYTPLNSGIGFWSVWHSTIDTKGNLWFGGFGSGVTKYDGTAWTRYNSIESGLQNESVHAIVADNNDNIWVGTNSGLHRYDGNSWITYTQITSNILIEDISAINVSPSNDIWVGVEDIGVAKLDNNNSWTVYTSTAGIYSWENVSGFAFDENQDVWISVDTKISKLDKTTQVFNSVVNLGWNRFIYGFGFDAEGTLWVGTRYGLATFNGNDLDFLYTDQHPSVNDADAITLDQDGNLWISAELWGGILELKNTTWITHCPGEVIVNVQGCSGSTDLEVDSQGNIWATRHIIDNNGFPKGAFLGKWDGSDWITYTTSLLGGYEFLHMEIDAFDNIWTVVNDGTLYKFDGVSEWETFPASPIGAGWVMAIQEDAVWISGFEGAARFSGNTWVVFDTADGLPDNKVYAMAVDSSNNIWFGTYEGVTRFDGITWTTFTIADGLSSNEINDITIGPDGVIWVAMDRDWPNEGGVAYFDGSSWHSYSHPYLVNGSADLLTVDNLGNVWILNGEFGYRVFNTNGLHRTQVISATGGIINSINERVSAIFPSGTFTDSVIVSLRSISPFGVANKETMGPFFELTAELSGTHQSTQLMTDQDYTLSAKCDLSSSLHISEFSLYYWDGLNWQKQDSIAYKSTCTVTALTDKLGLWAVLGETNKLFLPIVTK